MCGIAGIFNIDGSPLDARAIERMSNVIHHRGPDDEGYLLVQTQSGDRMLCGGPGTPSELGLPSLQAVGAQSFNLAFSFRRLAILDLSPAGHQPMASRDGRYWIVFNGEIYNYLELRSELINRGYDFRTGTDTEVILAAYQEWGEACLSRFNGMWAFALWDQQERRLFIARDRFGVKPLYYTFDGQRLTFASEIKALVGKHGVPFEPDDEIIYRYLMIGLLPSPQSGRTFFRNVRALPPGHYMTLQGKELRTQRFWTLPPEANGARQDPGTVVEQYRELFTDSVRLRLRADVPIGTCLSGGVDSSSIVCVVNRLMAEGGLTTEQIGQQQKTFSAVYTTAGRYNERDYIEKVLRATGAEGNFTFPSADRLQDDIERLVWHQDEPFQSTSIFAQWCVMHSVRERGVTVLLDGQGADEVLAGYRPFKQFLGDLVRHGQLLRAVAEAQAIQARTGTAAGPLLARAVASQLPSQLMDPVRRRRSAVRGDYSLLNPDFAARCQPETVSDWWPWSEHTNLESHLRNLVYESSLPHLLRYEDRNSMAFSIEARVPYLDYRLVEFSFTHAHHWRIHQGWTKWTLRKAMEGIVPDAIIWRTDKVGFETPEEQWMQHWLRTNPDFFQANAHSSKYLDLDAVQTQIAAWQTSGGDVRMIWRWINLELWLRVWNRV